MHIQAIRTEKILALQKHFTEVLDSAILSWHEDQILVITSKIVSLCEGSVRKIGSIDKTTLIEEEAELFIPPEQNPYNITLTIKRNMLVPTAGIDESNTGGYYVLWPKNPQQTANDIRTYLHERFGVQRVGVIITDSKTSPLRWGTKGIALAHSGFLALKNYIDTPDIYGHHLRVTKANIGDALAAAAVVTMGEGNEQTPLAIIDDIPFVAFQDRNPTTEELAELAISLEEDLYGPLLKNPLWKKGRAKTGQ